MATKVLNLDKLRIAREVIINGVTFKVLPLTVREFIETEGLEKKLEAMTPMERMKTVVEFVGKHLADFGDEKVADMDLEMLLAVAQFLRGSDDNTEAKTEGNAPAQ